MSTMFEKYWLRHIQSTARFNLVPCKPNKRKEGMPQQDLKEVLEAELNLQSHTYLSQNSWPSGG